MRSNRSPSASGHSASARSEGSSLPTPISESQPIYERLLRLFPLHTRILAVFILFSLLAALAFPLLTLNRRYLAERIQSVEDWESQVNVQLLSASSLLNAAQANITRNLAVSLLAGNLPIAVPQPLAGVQISQIRSDLEEVDLLVGQADMLLKVQSRSETHSLSSALADIRTQLAVYQELATQLDESIQAGDLSKAVELLNQAGERASVILSSLEAAIDDNTERSSKLNSSLLQQSENRERAGLWLFAIVLIAGLAGAWTVAQSIARPATEIRMGIELLVQSEQAAKLEDRSAGRAQTSSSILSEVGRDELTRSAKGLNNLSAILGRTISELQSGISERTFSLNRQTNQMQTSADIARDAASGIDQDQLLTRVVGLLYERFELYFVGIYLVEEADAIGSAAARSAILKTGTGDAGRVMMKRGRRVTTGSPGAIGFVLAAGVSRITQDVDVDFIFQRDVLLPGTRSQAVLPLKASEQILGVLEVHSTRKDAFDKDVVVALQTLADQLAMALQNIQLRQNLARTQAELTSLSQRNIQQTWISQASARRALGYQYDLLDVKPVEPGLPFALPKELAARLNEGHVVVVNQTMDSQSDSSQLQAVSTSGSVLLAPITMVNQVIGVIGLEEIIPGYEWTNEQINMVEALTGQISLALDNARLLEETQRRSNQIRLLQEVTSVAASHTNLVDLLDNVVQKMRSSLDLSHCGMIMLDNPSAPQLTGTLVATASKDPFHAGARLLGMNFNLSGRAVGEEQPDDPQAARFVFDRVRQNNRTEVVKRADFVMGEADDRQGKSTHALESFMDLRETSLAAITPITSRGETIGFLTLEISADKSKAATASGQSDGTGENLESDIPSSSFGLEDVQLFDQISLQISSAVDVARSFEQTTRRAERERLLADITSNIRQTLDMHSILRTAAEEIRKVLGAPEVIVRLAPSLEGDDSHANTSQSG